jgi:hypothetical protein
MWQLLSAVTAIGVPALCAGRLEAWSGELTHLLYSIVQACCVWLEPGTYRWALLHTVFLWCCTAGLCSRMSISVLSWLHASKMVCMAPAA